jgi:hypothetical protein
LKDAVPAKLSFIGGFRLDAKAPRYLPPQLATALSREDVRRAKLANERGLTWQEYQRNIRIEAGTDSITVLDGPVRTKLEIYARRFQSR